MPGPRTPKEALAWAQGAMEAGRYIPSVHFGERLAERKLDMLDVLSAIASATRTTPYAGDARHGGTCWRIAGPDVDGTRTIAVGVETFLDHKRRRVVLATVIDVTRS